MSDNYTFDEYQIDAASTDFYPNDSIHLSHVTLGLTGEAGGVANEVKKIQHDDCGLLTPLREKQIIGKLGNVLWYVAAICRDLDIKMGDVAHQNFVILASREARGTLSGDGDKR